MDEKIVYSNEKKERNKVVQCLINDDSLLGLFQILLDKSLTSDDLQ